MGTKHKHAEVIKAWADGAEIEVKIENAWHNCGPYPGFSDSHEYRIKPPKKTPGQVFFESVATANCEWKDVYDKNYFETGSRVVIEAYKRGEFDEVQDKGDDLR